MVLGSLFGNARISKAPSVRDLLTLAFFKNCLANSSALIKIEEEVVPVVPTLGLLNPWCRGCWQSLNSCKIGRALSELKQYFHGQAQTWKKGDIVIVSGQFWALLSGLKISNLGKARQSQVIYTNNHYGQKREISDILKSANMLWEQQRQRYKLVNSNC